MVGVVVVVVVAAVAVAVVVEVKVVKLVKLVKLISVYFFDIATSKSGPTMVCFAHFDLEMCFAPQRRALFRHRNFQNVLRATTACTFSTSQLPKVVRHSCVLYILPSKCASRHNGMHFFDIATSKSGPLL